MEASLFDTLLPPESGVRIRSITFERSAVVVELVTTSSAASCPQCGGASAAVHSRYRRHLQDQPCRGQRLRLAVTARKFICPRADCPRRVFCERLPELTEPHARTTGVLAGVHRAIGLALGGEGGARLAARLSMPTSPDTLLRRVKDHPGEPCPSPRYVGLDDWASRKGRSYGTILIDLERRCVIDILPGRDGEAVRQWLATHPQVEIITRDRWPAYIEAANTAAPQARQVADRFHLLRNVREAVEKLLARHGSAIRAASAAAESSPTGAAANTDATAAAPEPGVKPRSKKEQHRVVQRRLREERFRQVKTLLAQGQSCRAIARRLGLNLKVVLRYRRLDECPNWAPGRVVPTQLDPFAAAIAAWVAAGNRNSADLFRDLKAQGYVGGYDAVRRYVNRLIGSSGRPGRRDPDARRRPPSAPSARKLSFRVVNPKPESRSARVLKGLRERDPKLDAALVLAEELLAMVRRQCPTTLPAWASKAEASGDVDLRNLAVSLMQDAAAVEAALTTSWSNGPVEGHVNRLKTIKRQMYGRAGMALLKARVRHKG
jgi:transposase